MPVLGVRTRSRRGASLALAAFVSLFVFGVGAIAIDLGMLYKARSDALRAAEAAALAGASAFLDFADPFSLSARQEAADRAIEYARRNAILTTPIGADEVDPPQVIPESLKVRVRIERDGIATWFAKALGDDSVRVSAGAAAVVEAGDEVSCVSPFMIPDSWDEGSQDLNGNRWEDSNEEWTYDGQQDEYSQNENGLGSDYRNNRADEFNDRYTSDFGRLMTLKRSEPGNSGGNGNGNGGNGNGGNGGNGNGNGNGNGGNGNGNGGGNGNGNGNTASGGRGLNVWDFWSDGNNGNQAIRDALEGCGPTTVTLGEDKDLVPNGQREGVMGDVRRAIRDRIQADNSTRWDESTGGMISGLPDWRSSPRVIKIALYDPEILPQLGPGSNIDIPITNVALFYLENMDGEDNITGRFLYYVTGSGSNGEEEIGSMVKHLRLVE